MPKTASASFLFRALLIGSVCMAGVSAYAPARAASPQQRRLSPHETISKVIDGNRVTLVYGRPYSKDPKSGAVRKIWGSLVPYAKVWRTGADEATLLITQRPILLGGTLIPSGAYTLFTEPEADGTASLIVNSQLGQWGLQYDKSKDFARVGLARADLDSPVDQFTMDIAKNPAGGGSLEMRWEMTQYSVPYTVQK